MKNITLLVMAAGMGSRYGGLKQLDQVGANGETIIDYSLFDAIKSGFNKVVFVIRKEFENEFRSQITNKFAGKIEIEFAFQDINDLPKGYSCPTDRIKPWGTGHAILATRNMINEPFVVINGDDFYGLKSFEVIADYYRNGGKTFSMVAFQLDNTLSEFGGVSRGLCVVKNQFLDNVTEIENIKNDKAGISSDSKYTLKGTEPVSMNMWGFTPDLFHYLRTLFIDFLISKGKETKSEYLIPTVINHLINNNLEKVKVLNSNENWFGVTYQEDKRIVKKKIQKLIADGVYPSSLS